MELPNDFMYRTKNGRFKKLGEIKSFPELVPSADESAFADECIKLQKMVGVSYTFTFRFSKEFSKHLHYAKYAKKFRQRKKHVRELVEIYRSLRGEK